MWDEVCTVFWLEYRRHLRSRLFWRLLLVITGASMACAALYGLLLSGSDPSSSTGQAMAPLAMGLLAGLGGVALIAPAVVVPRIFSDLYKTRELHDIYLTTLHPVAIVLGRTLTASVQVGLVLLTLFPAGLLICQLAGFAPGYWLSVLFLTWCALLVMLSLSVQGLGKRFPADIAGALTGAPSNATSMVFWLGILSAGILLRDLLAGSSAHLPLYLAFPLLTPYEALAYCSLNGWELPLWMLALPMMAGVVALSVVAAAQWLGWWSDVAYRRQRWGGTALFLIAYALNLAIYAQDGIKSAADAERVVFWGMITGALSYALLLARLLGYYGMGVRPRPTRYALPPPLGGVVWEWVLLGSIALLAWLVVGWASGYWVEPGRWLAWSGCMVSLLLLAQAWHADVLSFYWLWLRQPPEGRHVLRGEVRAYIEVIGSRMASTLFWTLLIALMVSRLLSFIPQPVIKTLGSWLVLINPLSGLSSFAHDIGHYGRYMVYTLLLTAVLVWRNIRRGRAWYFQQRAWLLPPEGYISQEHAEK